jgi:hypothetical protein
MIKDIVILIDNEARIVAHRVDCYAVLEGRVNKVPMMTMFDIANPIPPHIKKHECLNDV